MLKRVRLINWRGSKYIAVADVLEYLEGVAVICDEAKITSTDPRSNIHASNMLREAKNLLANTVASS
jgi:hypothetical protein